MASPAKKISLFLLLTLSFSLQIHARDSQFFNKIPSTTNKVVVPNNKEEIPTYQQEQQPNFLPQNENSYGLYGHESGQDPPSASATTTTTTIPAAAEFKQPTNKYLPKNYNPVAYVTQPDDVNEGTTTFADERSFTTNSDNNNDNRNNYYNGGAQNYYSNQQQLEKVAEFRNYPTAATNRGGGNGGGGSYYYSGGSSFNSQPQGDGGAAFGGRGSGFQPQGMSDTRFLENGKYHYDINTEKYSSNHPYESLRGARAQQNEFSNNRNFYGNNAYEFNGENSVGGYDQSQEEFQNEENMP